MQAAARIARRASAGPPPGSALLVVGSVFLAASGIAGLVLGAELARPGLGVVSPSRYDALLSDHAIFTVYLGLWPLAVGAAAALIRTGRGPSAVGAALVLAGGIVAYDGLRRRGAFATGWTSYAPGTTFSHFESAERELAIGLALALLGLMCAAVPLIGRRSPLARAVVASAAVLPFLVAGLIAQAAGAFWSTPRHVTWLAVVLPAVGAAGEIVTRQAALPLSRLYDAALAAFVLVAAAVWLEHTIRAPLGESSWESTALAAPVVLAIVAVLAGGAARRARPTAPVLFATVALLALVAGGALGLWVATQTSSLYSPDTQLADAHLHLVLLGGLCGLLALAFSARPGRSPRLGAAALALLVAGTGALTAAEAVAGRGGMPRRVADYAPRFAGESLAAAVGGGLVAAALVVFLLNEAQASRRRGREQERDRT